MSLSITETVGLVVAVFLLIYYYSVSKFEFWQKRGVKGPKPIPFFGNFKDVFLGRGCVHECFEKAYYDYKDEPVIGLYAGNNPLLVLRDPDLIKDVLIKDFPKFAERTQRPYREVCNIIFHILITGEFSIRSSWVYLENVKSLCMEKKDDVKLKICYLHF